MGPLRGGSWSGRQGGSYIHDHASPDVGEKNQNREFPMLISGAPG